MDSRKRQEAIHVTGDANEPTRRVGTSQPSISRWPKVRADRVLSVEAVMEEARAVLWPDLGDEEFMEIDDVDATRAQKASCLPETVITPG